MTLERLWAGWRHEYVASATANDRAGGQSDCVFCRIVEATEDGQLGADNGVVWRDATTFAVLNAFPYTTGHLLVMPVRHVSGLDDLSPGESAGLWEATRDAATAINKAYDPDGLNMGANLGRAAGAGIPMHLHLHVLPRWVGDTNFMTAVAGVRVLPESLPETWRRLNEAWPERRART